MGQTLEADRTPGLDHHPVKHKGLLAGGGCLSVVLVLAVAGTLFVYAVDWKFPIHFDLSLDPGSGCADSSNSLVRAATAGDTRKVTSALRRHEEPDATDGSGDTALACAVEHGHLEAAKALLDAGASPDGLDAQSALCPDLTSLLARPGTCNTPIARAVGSGHADLVTLLVAHGAKPTPGLYVASMKNRPDLAQILLDHGADPNATDGTTPLLYNVMFANRTMIDLLLAHGADPNRGGPADAATLRIAVDLQRNPPDSVPAALRTLVCGEQGTAPNLPPLVVAAGLGDATSTAALLAHGADPNGAAAFDPAVTPLGAATAVSSTEVAALLVAAGARPAPAPAPSAASPAPSVAC